jgi:hypothetical protein
MRGKSDENALITMPAAGPGRDLVMLSARYSRPEALKAWDKSHGKPVYTVQCKTGGHRLASVYQTANGRMLDMPEATPPLGVWQRLMCKLMDNERDGVKPDSELDLPRVLFDNCSDGIWMERMCVPLYELTGDMLAMHVPLGCSCSISMELTFGDLAQGSGHGKVRNEYPRTRRRSTKKELVGLSIGASLLRYGSRLRGEGVPEAEAKKRRREWYETHHAEVQAEAERKAEEMYAKHWRMP